MSKGFYIELFIYLHNNGYKLDYFIYLLFIRNVDIGNI